MSEAIDAANPRTVREIELTIRTADLRTAAARDWGIESFTCDDCAARFGCSYAFDPYNTEGDCLGRKMRAALWSCSKS